VRLSWKVPDVGTVGRARQNVRIDEGAEHSAAGKGVCDHGWW